MRRWFSSWRRGSSEHITWGGALFTLSAVLIGLAAMASANNLLFLVLATMLSLLLVSGLVSRLCLAGLELDFVAPEHISAGRDFPATLAVRNVKSWMPSLSIKVTGAGQGDAPPALLTSAVYFPVIPGGATLNESVRVRFARRGMHRQDSFLFSTRFPFGFGRKVAQVALRRDVLVYPSLEPQPGFEEMLSDLTGDLDAHHRGRGGDFYRIRPYEAFESARHVDWRATAHTGELQVREFVREQERAIEIFLDRDIPPEAAEWFERAVACCTFLVWRLSQRGATVRFRSQDYLAAIPQETNVYAVLKHLALVLPARPGAPAAPPADPSSFQMVFSASPVRFTELGWSPDRLVGVADLAPSAAVS